MHEVVAFFLLHFFGDFFLCFVSQFVNFPFINGVLELAELGGLFIRFAAFFQFGVPFKEVEDDELEEDVESELADPGLLEVDELEDRENDVLHHCQPECLKVDLEDIPLVFGLALFVCDLPIERLHILDGAPIVGVVGDEIKEFLRAKPFLDLVGEALAQQFDPVSWKLDLFGFLQLEVQVDELVLQVAVPIAVAS